MFSNYNCGKRIKELRITRGLLQERIALNAGITPVYLGLVEREKRNPTVVILERICMGMNVSLAEFFAVDTLDKSEDPIGKQILFQINGLNDEGKQIMLQIVKDVLFLRKMASQAKREEVCC